MRKTIVASLLALAILVPAAFAERPSEQKDTATNVFTGTIKSLDAKDSLFGKDGKRTDYTAEVEVTAVDKGDGLKVGDTVKVTWFHVTKRPSGAFAGAYGHGYEARNGLKVKVWVKKSGEKYEVIYNSDGMETVGK
jgi:hypothetical protein